MFPPTCFRPTDEHMKKPNNGHLKLQSRFSNLNLSVSHFNHVYISAMNTKPFNMKRSIIFPLSIFNLPTVTCWFLQLLQKKKNKEKLFNWWHKINSEKSILLRTKILKG